MARQNLPEALKVASFSKERGLRCDFLAVVPAGRAGPEALPDRRSYSSALRALMREYSAAPMNLCQSLEAPSISVYEASYAALMAEEGLGEPPRLCSIGSLLHVMEDGWARPCVFLPFELGSVRRRPLSELWAKLRESRFFSKLMDPDALRGSCGECKYRRICGGCRARAYRLLGDPLAEDPMCALAG